MNSKLIYCPDSRIETMVSMYPPEDWVVVVRHTGQELTIPKPYYTNLLSNPYIQSLWLAGEEDELIQIDDLEMVKAIIKDSGFGFALIEVVDGITFYEPSQN